MKRFAIAIVLACALSGTTFAGIIHSTDVASPGDIPSTGSTADEVPSVGLAVLLSIVDLAF